MPGLLRYSGVAAMVGFSARTLRRLVAAGRFPAPVRVDGLRGMFFRREDVEAWLAER